MRYFKMHTADVIDFKTEMLLFRESQLKSKGKEGISASAYSNDHAVFGFFQCFRL